MRAVLPAGVDSAAPQTDPEVRKLCAGLWKDIAAWAQQSGEPVALQGLVLFRAEPPPEGVPWPARGLPPGPPCEWAFAPAADLLLLVGEGLVGVTAEGVFTDNRAGHERRSFDTAWWLREDCKDEREEDKHEETWDQAMEEQREDRREEKRKKLREEELRQPQGEEAEAQ